MFSQTQTLNMAFPNQTIYNAGQAGQGTAPATVDFVALSPNEYNVTEAQGTATFPISGISKVRNNDGGENIVPNESFVTSAVLNHSYTESTSVQYIDISVAYDADVERALAIMLEEGMRARPRIDTGRRGWAYLDTFGDSGINLRLGFWVKDPVNGVAGLKTAISLAILKRFAEEGIEVPYNQLEVNLRKVDVGEIPVRMKVQSS